MTPFSEWDYKSNWSIVMMVDCSYCLQTSDKPTQSTPILSGSLFHPNWWPIKRVPVNSPLPSLLLNDISESTGKCLNQNELNLTLENWWTTLNSDLARKWPYCMYTRLGSTRLVSSRIAVDCAKHPDCCRSTEPRRAKANQVASNAASP